jgi:hypothetical protein
VLLDATQMHGGCPAEAGPTRGRHRGETAASVSGIGLALDQTGAGHLVNEPAHPASAENHPVGKLVDPQAAIWRGIEDEQHLVPAERQPGLGLDLALQALDHRSVGAEEGRKGAVIARGAGHQAGFYGTGM